MSFISRCYLSSRGQGIMTASFHFLCSYQDIRGLIDQKSKAMWSYRYVSWWMSWFNRFPVHFTHFSFVVLEWNNGMNSFHSLNLVTSSGFEGQWLLYVAVKHVIFFSPLLRYVTDKIVRYLKFTTWCLDISKHRERIFLRVN